MAGLNDTDIRLDDSWQLTRAANGDAPIVAGLYCIYQDIQLEAHSQEGELFYDTDWGWSLLDFLQSEDDELLELEIQERIKTKLARRSEVDAESISTSVVFSNDMLIVQRCALESVEVTPATSTEPTVTELHTSLVLAQLTYLEVQQAAQADAIAELSILVAGGNA